MSMSNSYLTEAEMADTLRRLLEGTTGSPNTSEPHGVHEESKTDRSSTNSNFSNLNTGNYTAFTPILCTSASPLNPPYMEDADAWAMLARAFPDTGIVAPQLVGETHWAGVSNAADSTAATPYSVMNPGSSATPPGSQDDPAWLFGPHCFEVGSGGTLITPESGTKISGTTYPVGWATNEVAWSIPAVPETFTTAAPGKRRRDESHGDRVPVVVNSNEMPPRKRVRGGNANGIPNTVESAITRRTHHKHRAGIPKTKINCEPKQPVRGAKRLATADPQGFHHQSLLGPSLQQGWAEEDADGCLIWVEGSVEELVHRQHSTDSTVPEQQEEEEQVCFKIPEDFTEEYQALLVASKADLARRTVRKIQCKLCPNAKFNKWGPFKRHCEFTESHPLKIFFCVYCGEYFARSDTCLRHQGNRPAQCHRVLPEEAAARRDETERARKAFLEMLKASAGEEVIVVAFSDMMRGIFSDSSLESSKKRRRKKIE